ncbi:DnaB-like helicase C-terminal domain-containing protein [Francisella marina]|uniref:AAA family ATPase n=1 Tax=Francisella marina TaxID=2249302 RepID=A0ABX5ZHW0_9GAMM|nr:DnaB-like helicase C-terminal domain-containing protein [Francisella marina]QEO57584.1 AAA family ATPase [Francisella marina]QEO58301.1 AAA family ATPase [Francisella marina]
MKSFNKQDIRDISTSKYEQILDDLQLDVNDNIISNAERNATADRKREDLINEYLEYFKDDISPKDYISEYNEINNLLTAVEKDYVTYDISNITAKNKYKDYLKSLDIERKNKIETGFHAFDNEVKGISSGLTIVTGLSSLGKSTFCTQLADQIAMRGDKVLYLNAEMQDSHVFSKSITRLSGKYQQLSFYDILTIKDCQFQPKIDSFVNSINDFNTFADNLIIKQVSKNWGSELRQDIKALTKINDNKPPVVFIDYIQILPTLPESQSRGNEYVAINETVSELKSIIQETGAYIVAISSLSRASYEKGISLSSLKASGNLEYSAEMVLAIEPCRDELCEGEPIYDNKKQLFNTDLINTWKKLDEKVVTVRVLKNRMGRTGHSFDLLFESAKAKFTESSI